MDVSRPNLDFAGMYEKMKKGAKLLDGEDILEYNGPGKQNRNTQVNCRGFCRGMYLLYGSVLYLACGHTKTQHLANTSPEATKKRGIKTECDEYPPGTSIRQMMGSTIPLNTNLVPQPL